MQLSYAVRLSGLIPYPVKADLNDKCSSIKTYFIRLQCIHNVACYVARLGVANVAINSVVPTEGLR
jgi:hypothetical protein